MKRGLRTLGSNAAGDDFNLSVIGQTAGPEISGLEGMTNLTIYCLPSMNSGSGEVRVYIQTSLNEDGDWFDIACFKWDAVGFSRVQSMRAHGPIEGDSGSVTNGLFGPSYANLADDTCIQGCLGPRIRAMVEVATGSTYTGSGLCVRAMVLD